MPAPSPDLPTVAAAVSTAPRPDAVAPPAEQILTAAHVTAEAPPAAQPEAAAPADTRPAIPAAPEALTVEGQINRALEESARLLLGLKDMRVTLVALARQAEGTAMGAELRRDVLEMVGRMKGERLTDEQKRALEAQQKLIQSLQPQLPPKPQQSAFELFLQKHPKEAEGFDFARMALALNTGKLTAVDLTQHLQESQGLREPFLTELLGQNRAKFQKPEDVLGAVNIAPTEPNVTALREALTPPAGPNVLRFAGSGLMVSFALLMILAPMMDEGQGGGGGGH